MHEGCDNFTCRSCIWADQCASDSPCEHYHDAGFDPIDLDAEEEKVRHDQFITEWNELSDELNFFDN